MNVRSEMSRPAATQSKVERTRRRILDAALEVVAQRGYDGATVPAIAERASVGAGTIYRHFRDKEHLVNVLFRETKRRLWSEILGSLNPEGTSHDLFGGVWKRLAAFARREPLAFQFVEMHYHAPYLDDESRELQQRVVQPLEDWLVERSEGELPAPPDVIVALFWGAFVGLMKSERLGQTRLDDELVTRAGEVLWAGMKL
ncbi:MAG: TetR/AcrR family transcriptional regulator [Myxococcota bacterium]